MILRTTIMRFALDSIRLNRGIRNTTKNKTIIRFEDYKKNISNNPTSKPILQDPQILEETQRREVENETKAESELQNQEVEPSKNGQAKQKQSEVVPFKSKKSAEVKNKVSKKEVSPQREELTPVKSSKRVMVSDISPEVYSREQSPAMIKKTAPQKIISKEEAEQVEIDIKTTGERVSKYLSRTSVASRRQAEKMIEDGLIRVNGRRILANQIIDPVKDKVSIFTKKGEFMPMKETTKVWLFYKPTGLICTHRDTHGRPTIFDFIQKTGKIKEKHIVSVGRLDYNSEGLIILTNDGELASVMERPESKLTREYRVRVYGRFTEEKLKKIREGATINGVKYGPFWCEVDSYQTRNTWLRIKMQQGKNREIRRIMQKNDLRVNRLKREKYGTYSLANMNPGDVIEVIVEEDIKRLVYLSKRMKLKLHEEEKKGISEIKEEVQEKIVGRLLDPNVLLKKISHQHEDALGIEDDHDDDLDVKPIEEAKAPEGESERKDLKRKKRS